MNFRLKKIQDKKKISKAKAAAAKEKYNKDNNQEVKSMLEETDEDILF